jgi:diguanylate cyclase (GGDEF)-like protein
MLFEGIIIFLFILFLWAEFFSLRKLYNKERKRKISLMKNLETRKKEERSLRHKIDKIDKRITEYFLFYELTRKVAPILDKRELLSIFSEEVKKIGDIEELSFEKPKEKRNYFKFDISKRDHCSLYVKTKSKKFIEAFPFLVNLLKLCLERIDLYKKMQQLSIYDSLTGIYTRRYFMMRYLEEFKRAKKFNLNLSFLMVDIDHFKKINDTYGHLVGDIVLKEVARVIKESIREIDFVARFGGEEFSIILPETDKAGAIMVGERICSRISTEKIRAFDEILNATISVGVASYPQNTLHSDVLIEVADRALYKAKVSGRNRVCWF